MAAGLTGTAFAQTAKPSAPDAQHEAPTAACPPGVTGSPPTVGGPPAADLSDRLSDSKGVICPPAGVDPDIRVPPPAGGEIKVIPPPGSPGGDPAIQPK